MVYSREQFDTLQHVKTLLNEAGLQSNDLENIPSSPSESLRHSQNQESPKPSSPRLFYTSPPPYYFSNEDIQARKNFVTRKSSVQSIVDHPLGAIVEYPQTGTAQNLAVAHRFHIEPSDFVNPKYNIQYSLGDGHAIRHDILCNLLRDLASEKSVRCKQTKISCRSIKRCNFATDGGKISQLEHTTASNAEQEVFTKTLGFYCALREQGCGIRISCDNTSQSEIWGLDSDDETHNAKIEVGDIDPDAILTPWNVDRPNKCKGILVMEKDKSGRQLIRCEFYTHKTRGHLLLLNLNEYNLDYLKALFNEDMSRISYYEQTAKSGSYGPLVPCTVTATCREQKELCPFWHRDSTGRLQRGQLINMGTCTSRFEIYEPYDLRSCPYILLVCRHPHSHSPPTCTKTPESISRIFTGLLDHLGWRLADATPRRILLDAGFMYGLRRVLKWEGIRDPTLSDLHPSLANLDHTARLINKLRLRRYPSGTGLEGAKLLVCQNESLPMDDQYIRCVETYENPTDGKFHIVICMFKSMSYLLLQTKRPSIDTSFKRLHGWQEFEIEAWFSGFERSIVVARAFTTSQSAEAHHVLFRRMFQIVKEDTGEEVKFQYIHGTGFDTVTADGHRGQALGLGLYCQEICKGSTERCKYETGRMLASLTPTEHLARFYRYCFAHFTRNVTNLGSNVSSKVKNAMMSLASPKPLSDLEGTLALIRSGGKKAADWLKDKQSMDGFAFAAIYGPASKMPVEVWLAAPSTSNGNEQAHRNINRDGTGLTLLAGVMRGSQYDSRAIVSFHTFLKEGIYSRDCRFTYFRRASRAIRKKASAQERNIISRDTAIKTTYEKVLHLQDVVQTNAGSVKRAFDWTNNSEIECSQKRLRKSVNQLQKHQTQLSQLMSRGSGTVLTPDLVETDELFDGNLLKTPSTINATKTSPSPSQFPFPPTPSSMYPPCPASAVSFQTQSNVGIIRPSNAPSNGTQIFYPSSYIPHYDYSYYNF